MYKKSLKIFWSKQYTTLVKKLQLKSYTLIWNPNLEEQYVIWCNIRAQYKTTRWYYFDSYILVKILHDKSYLVVQQILFNHEKGHENCHNRSTFLKRKAGFIRTIMFFPLVFLLVWKWTSTNAYRSHWEVFQASGICKDEVSNSHNVHFYAPNYHLQPGPKLIRWNFCWSENLYLFSVGAGCDPDG